MSINIQSVFTEVMGESTVTRNSVSFTPRFHSNRETETLICCKCIQSIYKSKLIKWKPRSSIIDWVKENATQLLGKKDGLAWVKRLRNYDNERHNMSNNSVMKRRLLKICDIPPDTEVGDKDFIAKELYSSLWDDVNDSNWRSLKQALSKIDVTNFSWSGLYPTLDLIFDIFKLSPNSRKIIGWLYSTRVKNSLVQRFSNKLFVSACYWKSTEFNLVAGMLQIPEEKLVRELSEGGELAQKGLIIWDNDGDIGLTRMLIDIIEKNPQTSQEIKTLLFGKSSKPTLSLNDFMYVQDDFDHIKKVLEYALTKKKSGINILIYGTPGTGKTQLSMLLADTLGAALYSQKENVNEKDQRVKYYQLAQTILSSEPNSIFLFDEAEDAFCVGNSSNDNNSKLYYNQMLEKNKTPTIWITNNIGIMDSAYLRRFKYAFEMKKPPKKVKKGIWNNICKKHGVRLPEKELDYYVKNFDVTPSFFDSAIESAKIVKSKDAVKKTLFSLIRATTGRNHIIKADTESIPFDPRLINTDMDLAALTEKILKTGKERFSMCLFGVPGTGKSYFARYLAEQLNMEVEHKKASDIISKWVGETEQNIASAFEEAKDDRRLLIFDEADSFLRSRELAERSWEVSQVNEMLTQMESHPYPFICTTNLMKDMDAASLRRFTFKVKYDFMKQNQVNLAFKTFFGIEINPDKHNHLTKLTPGDFAVVKTKLEFMGDTSVKEILELLESEQSAKGYKASKMGF